MIALNELLSRFDEFDAYYKRIGFSADINKIKSASDERKALSLEFEKLRAENNKASAEIANLKNSGAAGAEIKSAMSEILRRERKIKLLKIKIDRLGRQINSWLKNLKCLPDDKLTQNGVVFEDFNASMTLKESLDVFKNNYPYELFGGKIKSFQKHCKNRVYRQDELMFSAICRDGMTIFCTAEQLDENFDELLKFFCVTAIKVVRLSDENLSGSATTEYKAYLKDRIVSLQKNREYFSREYNIKYHDDAHDVSRFVQQITLRPTYK